MIGQIDTLHPVFKLAVDNILLGMRERGWDAVIGSGMRTHEQQDALYAQGRQSLADVNALRTNAGLPSITADENKGKVTRAKGGQSNHNLTTSFVRSSRTSVHVVHGFAVDIIDRQLGWKANAKFWKDLGALAKQYGCEWGGDWKHPDPAHVQMKVIDGPPMQTVVV
jgi:peptidoglycan L-alanyl-D-glutamate endopeptidase CwlK